MARSPGFGSAPRDSLAPFALGFPAAPGLPSLGLAAQRNSQAYSTKDTPQAIMPATSCRSMVSGSLSLPSPGFFSPFPHGTCPLSVAAGYLALDRGRPGFGQGSSCPALLRYRAMETPALRLRGSHPLWRAFPCPSAAPPFSRQLHGSSPRGPTTPPQGGLGSSLFARRYWGNLS